jgi:hypothetical protein
MEAYNCPAFGCNKSFDTLNRLFQHIEKTDAPGHRPRARWLIIDKQEHHVYITDTPLGKLSLEKLREQAEPEPEPKQEVEIPA